MASPAPIPLTANPPESQAGSAVDRLKSKSAELKRGSKPGVTRGPYNKSKPEAGAVVPPSVAPPALFNDQNFGRLVSLSFNIMAVRTGLGGWELTQDELKELTVSGVPCCNEWVAVHPKWVSLGIFGLSLLSIGTSKILGHVAYLRSLEIERQKRPQQTPEPTPNVGEKPVLDLPAGPLAPTRKPPMQ